MWLCARQQQISLPPSFAFLSLFFFFFPSPSSCSFCLALLMLCMHITVQLENANYIFKNPCYIIAFLVVENWFFQRPNLQRELIFGGRTVRIAGRRLTLPTTRKKRRVNHNLHGFLSKDESDFVFSFPSDSH